MSGEHAGVSTPGPAPRGFSTRITRLARFLPRRSVPFIAAASIAAVVVVASVAAMTLGPATDTSVTAQIGPTTSAPGLPPGRDLDERRVSRSALRADPVPSSPSPSVSPSVSRPPASSTHAAAPPTKPTTAASPPSGGGAVTSSGTCGASYYGDGSHTADGEVFNPNAFTAANRTLPFNTRVRVTNPANGRSVVVRINDRGPFVSGRCLDLTTAAFAAIASLGSGVITVKYEVLS